MNKGPIAKYLKLRGEMNMPLSAKKTASFQGGLFVLFLLGAEDPPAKKKEE
jgi:hypothetical protein